jgi:hypothetical protein
MVFAYLGVVQPSAGSNGERFDHPSHSVREYANHPGASDDYNWIHSREECAIRRKLKMTIKVIPLTSTTRKTSQYAYPTWSMDFMA